MARNAARPDSDVDVLVTFASTATSERFFGVQFYLEDLFGRPVGLVSSKALRADRRPYVESEALHV
jgi:predicted nucleotidyltransferase